MEDLGGGVPECGSSLTDDCRSESFGAEGVRVNGMGLAIGSSEDDFSVELLIGAERRFCNNGEFC